MAMRRTEALGVTRRGIEADAGRVPAESGEGASDMDMVLHTVGPDRSAAVP